MQQISVNEFRANLKASVDKVIDTHEPLRVKRREGKGFIVISEEDWESEQETLYVLQNRDLMERIREGLESMKASEGYRPTQGEMDEILDLSR